MLLKVFVSSVLSWFVWLRILIRLLSLMIISSLFLIVIVCNSIIILIGLTKLIQDWSRPLCINCWNLSHYLAVVGMRIFSCLLNLCVLSFVWADLGRTCASCRIIEVLHCSSSARWRTSISGVAANVIDILIIRYPNLFKVIIQECKSFSITVVQSVSPELL